LLIAAAGALLVVPGVLSLRSSFTPLPRPRARTRLRESGVFRLVRHLVYGGAILIGLGWSLADAALGLTPTALLALLFDLKARREEAWLLERFSTYAAYRARTPRRFVPGSPEPRALVVPSRHKSKSRCRQSATPVSRTRTGSRGGRSAAVVGGGACSEWKSAPAGTFARMDTAAAIVLGLMVLLPAVLVGGLFVWAARKDGQEDKALQARLGIRRRTRLGR
jgi:hypothetical protein